VITAVQVGKEQGSPGLSAETRAARILVADDQSDVREALRLLLKSSGYQPSTVDSPAALLSAVESHQFDLILMDMNYSRDTTSGREGLSLLHRLRHSQTSAPIVVMTAWSDVDLAVEAMRAGASDFIQKPWDNTRLLACIAKHAAISASTAPSDLAIAHSVQQKLFPQKKKILQTLQYAGCCVPAQQVGGDYYDFLDLDRHRAGFVIADVSGKGVAAALLMANLQALFRSQSELALHQPSALLESVNQLFFEATAPEHYATLFFGQYDDRRRRLTYINCGHHSPILVRQSGVIEYLEATATVIGLFRGWKCEEAFVDLAPGDTLVLYSDGVVEAGIETGCEFGKDRLAATIQATRYQNIDATINRIIDAVRHCNPAAQTDDITIVAMRAI
jgi:sigma-B regulation protein RsbU (phosphoserine phosphatase)